MMSSVALMVGLDGYGVHQRLKSLPTGFLEGAIHGNSRKKRAFFLIVFAVVLGSPSPPLRERGGLRMSDFVAVLADHIENDVVLTALTNFEKGGVFGWSRRNGSLHCVLHPM
jgi:hypothetical protein